MPTARLIDQMIDPVEDILMAPIGCVGGKSLMECFVGHIAY